jgi:hypothetical protein
LQHGIGACIDNQGLINKLQQFGNFHRTYNGSDDLGIGTQGFVEKEQQYGNVDVNA